MIKELYHVIENRYIKGRGTKETIMYTGSIQDCEVFADELRGFYGYERGTVDCFVVSDEQLKKHYTKAVHL